ncbi:magnesium/cobalt transporter CorA [Stratiformator vulcanicus]|uniref:Magnesium transport protein CorA n=1 Tax=Stratiformator vulcanicus TaxID=2527980 RepID=A0A517R3N1_9PLAN|nr:magnesium/cobalt transporter CorA [Stratiformator vulcanicus]QDT38466.1 Magnesium transport protein CorA [Stratiformator vulcanicus]
MPTFRLSKRVKRPKEKFRFRRRSQPGSMPGTIAPPEDALPSKMRLIVFDQESFIEEFITDVSQIEQYRTPGRICWLDVDGYGEVETLLKLGKMFGLHDLALEDVVNAHQRPKVDDYDQHLFVVARMVQFDRELSFEQIGMFVGNDFVLTLQEGHEGDGLDPVRERIRRGKGRVRRSGTDYLAYTIIDAIVDGYFPVFEQYGARLSDIEDEIENGAEEQTINELHRIRRDVRSLRKAVWPHRDMLNVLLRPVTSGFIKDETQVFLRDVSDHVSQLIDAANYYREMCSDLRDFHSSQIDRRSNDVMKVLTIIATIFIPLSFIAGLYGMNFNPHESPYNMPELDWYFGYPFALALMAGTVLTMLTYFWRKKWIG